VTLVGIKFTLELFNVTGNVESPVAHTVMTNLSSNWGNLIITIIINIIIYNFFLSPGISEIVRRIKTNIVVLSRPRTLFF